MTPRPPASAARATALAITSGSGLESTCATDGAVRLQPVSCFGVAPGSVLNIVKEGTACPHRSADAEDNGSLHDEVDDRRGALRDDECDGHRPPPVVHQHQAQVVETDLDSERDGVENHHRDEPLGAWGGLKC